MALPQGRFFLAILCNFKYFLKCLPIIFETFNYTDKNRPSFIQPSLWISLSCHLHGHLRQSNEQKTELF